jgi:hypothetical protein
MAELYIGGVAAPSATKYDLTYTEINGTEETFENGSTYIEQIKNKVPSISVSWTNLGYKETKELIDAVTASPIFEVQYLEFEEMITCNMRCKSPKATLKFDNGKIRLYDVSMTLEGC